MSWSDMQCADFAPRQGRVEMSPGSTKVGGAGCRSPQFDILCTYGQTKEEDGGDPPGPTSHLCYDHALLVTGYDVLLSTLQGDLSFSASSASSFASTHAGPDHFHLIDLRLRHHALSDSCLDPPSRVLPHGQLRSFDISTPLPLDLTMTYASDPDSNPYPFHDIIAYRSPTIRPLPLTLTIRTAIRYLLIPLHDRHFPLSLTYCTLLRLTLAYAVD